jgi:hypothetical protein
MTAFEPKLYLANQLASYRPSTHDRVMGDGIFLAEIFEQRRQRCEPQPDRAAAKLAPHQFVTPGDDVGARHGAEFLRPDDAGEAHEIADRVFVGAASAGVTQIGESFDLGRHVGQPVKLGGGEQPVGGCDLGRDLVWGIRGHVDILLLKKSVFNSKLQASELREGTIERVLGMSDLELGLRYLLGKQPSNRR